jgi:hypothetical protein
MPKGTHAPTSELSREISRVLSETLDSIGATKKGASRDTGISRTMIFDMLSGNKHWTIDYLDKMCAYLGLDLETVIKNAEKATEGRELPQPFTNQKPMATVSTFTHTFGIDLNNFDPEAPENNYLPKAADTYKDEGEPLGV